MPNKMLIDASHPEETRVVVVRGNRIEEFDFESQDKKQLKGNIYLARVTRVEPSLQAAFVEYGGNRHGFLAFSEIHPDYYQIPVADRQALLRAEAEDARSDDDEDEEKEERGGRNRRRRKGNRGRGRNGDEAKASDDNGSEDADGETSAEDAGAHASDGDEHAEGADDATERSDVIAQSVASDVISEAVPASDQDAESSEEDESGSAEDDSNDHDDDATAESNGDDEVVSVGADDAMEEVQERRRTPRRHYKIQEVIKRRQILLVQVVKEERGNKGAALTTYLSLAGRYSVLMPNTARGGGISRKITNAADRKRLKDVVKDLDVPQGMGVILRTAGETRTKAEIKRDYEYLMRMWDNVRELTLRSTAPALTYEEGSLIKRSVRDLYNKDISEISVAGEEGYREAKDFMRMLMPSHAKVVQPYRDPVPIFARNGIEGQLDKILQPQVTLKSGGYLIINQTEALVAIDVNSGRSTKEHSIEDTALQTNLEAAEEVARQLRLRDLAGLIVIDFIDMEENRNNRAVEKKLKDCLKNDRARIQVGRISHFGLLEMSRQRIRASVLESTTQVCSHCGGTGHVRSESSVGLLVIRAIEEFLLKDSRCHISVRTPTSTAIYVLNHKRSNITELENKFGVDITLEADDSLRTQHYAIFKGAPSERQVIAPVMPAPSYEEEDDEIEDLVIEDEAETEEASEAPQEARADESNGDGQRKRKRRRRRRGGRDRDQEQTAAEGAASDSVSDESGDADVAEGEEDGERTESAAGEDENAPKKRRRGKRGGKRNRRDEAGEDGEAQADGAEAAVTEVVASETAEPESETPAETIDQAAMEAVEQPSAPEVVSEEEKPKKKPARRSTRKAKTVEPEVSEAVADLEVPATEDAATEPVAKPKAKRAPRRKVAAVVEEATASEAVAAETAPAEAPAAPAPEAPAAEVAPPREEAPAPVEAPAKPSEPVVTSTTSTDEKPKKGGWWQRKGFF
jgi:ribonuclease E